MLTNRGNRGNNWPIVVVLVGTSHSERLDVDCRAGGRRWSPRDIEIAWVCEWERAPPLVFLPTVSPLSGGLLCFPLFKGLLQWSCFLFFSYRSPSFSPLLYLYWFVLCVAWYWTLWSLLSLSLVLPRWLRRYSTKENQFAWPADSFRRGLSAVTLQISI